MARFTEVLVVILFVSLINCDASPSTLSGGSRMSATQPTTPQDLKLFTKLTNPEEGSSFKSLALASREFQMFETRLVREWPTMTLDYSGVYESKINGQVGVYIPVQGVHFKVSLGYGMTKRRPFLPVR